MSQMVIESTLHAAENILRFDPGDVLFREGDDPRGVLVLHSGTVDLLFSARNGSVKPLRRAGAGQILGLSSVVGRRPHDCTATARSSCEAGFVGRETFLEVLEKYPAVWFNVLRLLSDDVNAAYDDIRALAAR